MFSLLQSHRLLGTRGYVRERVYCAFAKFLEEEKNDMKMPNGQMDGWMRVRTLLCLYLHRKRLPNILTTHSAKSRGLGLLMAAKNNRGEIGALACITVTALS